MAGENEVFHAQISASDEGASKVIDGIKEHLHSLGREVEHVGHAEEHIHHPHMWMALGEHIDLTREHLHGLHASFGEVGSSVTELLPVLAAFGAAGTLEGMFEVAEHVAEEYSEMAHAARELGVSVEDMHRWQVVAKLTDTNAEGLQKSMSRLNRVLADTVAGKNKDVAALFAHLHIDPRSFKDSADALPALADAFEHTTDATMRTRMAFALFGKAGADMIPMLMLGREEIAKLNREAGHLLPNMEPYGKALEKYHEDQVKLNTAVGGFTELLGGKLAVALDPIIEKSTELVLANREWVSGAITGGVREFATWLEHVPWDHVAEEAKTAGHYAHEFIDDVGGTTRVVEVLAGVMALKGVLFLVEPIREAAELATAVGKLTIKIGTELVGAWNGVGTAAKAASAEEIAAAELSGVHGSGPAKTAHEVKDAEGIARGAKALRAVVRIAKVAPFVGIAVEGLQEVAQLLPIAAGVDVTDLHTSQQTIAARHGQGAEAGGVHDTGTRVDPHNRNRHGDDFHPIDTAAHIADRVLGVLPRPIWADKPGYSHETTTAMLQARDRMLNAAGSMQFMPDASAATPFGAFDPQAFMPVRGAPQSQSKATAPKGNVDITVHMPDLPQNARVDTSITGDIGNVRTNLGEAWMDLAR